MDRIYDATPQTQSSAGAVRGATPREIHELKQQDKCVNNAAAEQEPSPCVAELISALRDRAIEVYHSSNAVVRQAVGSLPTPEIQREYAGFKGELILALRYLNEASGNMAQLSKIVGVFLLCLMLSGAAFAQKPAAPAPAAATLTDDAEGCSQKVQPTTGLTECQMLRISNYLNQLDTVNANANSAKKPIADAANLFISKVVEKNPGKQYEPASQQFPLGRLVPIPPTPAAPPTAPAASAAPPSPAPPAVPAPAKQ